MKLTELHPRFMRREIRMQPIQVDWKPEDCAPHQLQPRVMHVKVDTLAEADGIFFLCPKCFLANKGPVGTHGVICWFEGKVPDDAQPAPGRWNPTGSGFADLSFVPGTKTRSVQLVGGCAWHGHLTNGDVE